MSSGEDSVVLLMQDIDDVQHIADAMYQQLSGRLQAMHCALQTQLRYLELQLLEGHGGGGGGGGSEGGSGVSHMLAPGMAAQATYKSLVSSATSPMASGAHTSSAALLAQHITADALRTPMRPSLLSLRSEDMHAYTPAACSPSPHNASAHSNRHPAATLAVPMPTTGATAGEMYDARAQHGMVALQAHPRARGDSTPLHTREQTLPPAPTPTHVFASRAHASHPVVGASPASVTTLSSALTTPSAPAVYSTLAIGSNSGSGTAAAAAAAAAAHATTTTPLSSERHRSPCHVLVAFKRHRVLRYRAPYYVAPGEYVVVGGDRGEDIGVVTRSWYDGDAAGSGSGGGAAAAAAAHAIAPAVTEEMMSSGSGHNLHSHHAGVHSLSSTGTSPTPPGRYSGAAASASDHAWADGVGEVLRVATPLEVTQLQGVQSELEKRAVEVAQEKVREHALPMRIVEAEYQFDRRKLTFYYQSQHRLDFRNLVRDLYKTFRARIWMELDALSTPTSAP